MANETNPFLLGLSIKDLDSNVRSEISYMDRNLTASIGNTTAQGSTGAATGSTDLGNVVHKVLYL